MSDRRASHGRSSALEEVRIAMGELFGAERRLRAREHHHSPAASPIHSCGRWSLLDKEETVTAGQLAKSADLNPASVTAMLDHLESNGIVERRRHPTDRRVCMVSLTGKGRGIVDEKRAAWQALWEERLGHLSESELLAALRVMKTMTDIIDEL